LTVVSATGSPKRSVNSARETLPTSTDLASSTVIPSSSPSLADPEVTDQQRRGDDRDREPPARAQAGAPAHVRLAAVGHVSESVRDATEQCGQTLSGSSLDSPSIGAGGYKPGRLAYPTKLASVPDPPPVSGISELVLEVSDLERARHFYREVLGFEETLYGEGREGRYWYLIGDSARLGLWTPQVGLAGGRGGAHVHFALRVPREALDAILERLRSQGVELEGPVQLGADNAIYITDPDGNVVEFWSQDMSEYAAGARAGRDPGTFQRTED
jgi:catechol 2,3-dioxygenase-like lactoylglutathione lyase family enzyme